MQDSKLGSLRHQIANKLNAHLQTVWAIEDKAKTWTQQPVPIMREHSIHLISLPIGFPTWLWRYTCLLLLMLMLWHRQAIFESRGDNLSPSAECRNKGRGIWDTKSPADWMPTHKLTELSRIKQNLNSSAHPYEPSYPDLRQHIPDLLHGYPKSINQRNNTHSIDSFVTLLKAYTIGSYSYVWTDINCYSCGRNVRWF